MSVPESTVWDIKPHTEAKHRILDNYLRAWIPILGQYNRRIAYVDGFAGPGEYSGGEPGSPVIALRAARLHSLRIEGEMDLWFIEKEGDRLAHLKGVVAEMPVEDKFNVNYRQGVFEDKLPEVLEEMAVRHQSVPPTFCFVDPFGYKGVPMPLLHELLGYESTEVFTNLAVDPANRFRNHPDENIQEQIRRLLGGRLPDERLGESGHNAVRRVYQSGMSEGADFVRSFEMKDDTNQPIYDLFFGTNHPKGHEKMKEAMWEVDPTGGFSFSDATDPGQKVLFSDSAGPQLLPQVLDTFSGRDYVEVCEIESWAVADTPFLRKHVRAALRRGERRGEFYVLDEKRGGASRQQGTFPSDAVIDFTRGGNPEVDQMALFET